MSSQLNVKRRFIDGRNDWRYQTEKAPVNTSGDQFIQGAKLFNDPVTFYHDVICYGKYQGDGSLLTNLNANDASKLPLAGGTMTGNIYMTNMSTPDDFMTITAASILASTTSNISTATFDSLGIYLNFDLTTVPKLFEIVPSGFRYTSGVTTYSTSLQKIAQLNEYISSIAIPPNANTLKVNNAVLVDAGTANKNTTVTDGAIVINNNVGGVTPALAINQTGATGGTIVHEMYNQRTAITGEANRISFFARNSATTKTEYARIHQNSSNIALSRGRLDFDVAAGSPIPTNFLSLNGSSLQVDVFKTLHMNNNVISGVTTIYTPNFNPYGKNYVQFCSGNSNIPATTPDDAMRYTLINVGVPDSIQPLASSFPSTWGFITCSVDFNSSTYVGTHNGYVYFSTDGVTWNTITESFNGKISCMTVYNNELYIGGEFTATTASITVLNRIARIDSSGNIYQIYWSNYMGSLGFNEEVRTLFVSSSNYLYMGGKFTYDHSFLLYCPYIAVMDGGFTLYNIDASFGSGYGFDNYVNFIEANPYAPTVFVIGGEFNAINVNSGSYSAPKNIIWHSDGTYNTDPMTAPYHFVSMNNAPVCITPNGANFYIGGYFESLPYGSYLATFEWTGSSYQIASNPYGASPSFPIIAVYQNGGIYWSDTAGQLFDAGNNIGQAPSGAWGWIYRAIWGELLFSTNSAAQDPVVAYYYYTSNFIQLSLTGGEIVNNASTYTGGINLSDTGSVVELVYSAGLAKWFVVNNISSGFF